MQGLLPTLARIRRVPFLIWLWIAQSFLLINAQAIAPAGEVQRFQTILIIYMLLQIAFYSLAPRVRGLRMNLNQAIPWFTAGFVATMFIMAGFQGLRGGLEMQTYAVSAAVYLIVMHTLVVAVAEELIFRGFLPALITVVPAQIAFGLFHASAYNLVPTAILIAIIAGFVFYGIYKFTNLWTAMGVHAAYNISILHLFGVL